MSFYKSIISNAHKFFHAITHATQLIEENTKKKEQNQQLQEELTKAKQHAEKTTRDMEDVHWEINDLRETVDYFRNQRDALRAALNVMHDFVNGGQLNGEQARNVYDAVSGVLDKDGFKLFDAAQDVLGKFSFSHFAYEDNLGYFEEADGFSMLSYLLVQYDYMLGEANDRHRWEITCSCYEKCIDFTIDETTPEYKEFENMLYIRVLENLDIFRTEGDQTQIAV